MSVYLCEVLNLNLKQFATSKLRPWCCHRGLLPAIKKWWHSDVVVGHVYWARILTFSYVSL